VSVPARDVGAQMVLDHFADLRMLKGMIAQFLGAREVKKSPKKGRRRRA